MPSSVNKSSLLASAGLGKSCNFKKFVPVLNEEVNKDETNEPCVTVEPRANKISDNYDTKQLFTENGICDRTNFTIYCPSNERSALGKSVELDRSENLELKSKDDVPDTQNEPGHVPAHILNGSLGVNAPKFSSQVSFQESMFHQTDGVQPNLSVNRSSTKSGITIIQLGFPSISPILVCILPQIQSRTKLIVSHFYTLPLLFQILLCLLYYKIQLPMLQQALQLFSGHVQAWKFL